MSETGRAESLSKESSPAWDGARALLRSSPHLLLQDGELLAELGLRPTASNVVDFVHPAVARHALAHADVAAERRAIEAVAQANFAAQAQAHAAVVELLAAQDLADLARRLDEAARLRFGLVGAVLALEGPGRIPAGWRGLPQGAVDALLGRNGLARMGPPPHAGALFGEAAARVSSAAMVRINAWTSARQGVLAFGSAEAEGFTMEMGAELVDFIARVVERTAERWPVL